MSDVKRNEHMLPIANWLREQINEVLARYDIPSDVYDYDILIDALCVCAVDKSQAALRARLEVVTEERNVQNDLRQIAEDAADEYKAQLATARRDAWEEALDAAFAYMVNQYGISALSNPIDRARITTTLLGYEENKL